MAFSRLTDADVPTAVYTDTSQIPFQHVNHLGSGTYAVVDAVKHISSGECFARKIIKHRAYSAERTAKTVLEEARIIRRLAHPHIISIHGIYEEPRGFGKPGSPKAAVAK
jgi:serine/threonine protein kinase